MRRKIGILGAGNVGASLGQLIVFTGLADLALVDVAEGLAEGKALDLAEARPLYGSEVEISGGTDVSLLQDSDLVVITAGMTRKPGMTREQLLEANARIVKECANAVKKFAEEAFVIVVTNPLDAMTWLVSEITNFPKTKVMGMAGILDSARFKHFLADALNVSVKDLQAIVLGGHGDEMVPVLSSATWQGIRVENLLSVEQLGQIVERTKNAGAEIVSKMKTSAFFSPSASVFEMIKAIFYDEKRLVPCSVWLNGEYGVKGLYIGVPVILGKNGVEKVVEIELTAGEKELFHKSVRAVQETVEELKGLKF